MLYILLDFLLDFFHGKFLLTIFFLAPLAWGHVGLPFKKPGESGGSRKAKLKSYRRNRNINELCI